LAIAVCLPACTGRLLDGSNDTALLQAIMKSCARHRVAPLDSTSGSAATVARL
jgi:hypothetical protein